MNIQPIHFPNEDVNEWRCYFPTASLTRKMPRDCFDILNNLYDTCEYNNDKNRKPPHIQVWQALNAEEDTPFEIPLGHLEQMVEDHLRRSEGEWGKIGVGS